MGQGFEFEEVAPMMDANFGWSDSRFEEHHPAPLKVKNTFLSDEISFDDVADAFGRRQVSAPAASANYLQPTPFMNGMPVPEAPFAGAPHLRVSDFILDEYDTNWQNSNWNAMPNGMSDNRRKKTPPPPPVPNAFGGLPTPGFEFAAPTNTMVAPDDGQMPPLMGGGFDNNTPLPRPPPAWENTTTVMMRNLPNKYTQRMLLSEINQSGFLGAFDFMYLPIDPETNANRGYAFLNFVNPSYAWMFKLSYEGRKMNRFNSNKVASVMRATLQGFDANYAHYSTARVNRGDPAARPLFLRESAQPVWNKKGDAGRQRGNKKKGIGNENGMNGMVQPEVEQKPPVPPPMTTSVGGATDAKPKLVPKFCPHCGGPIQPHFQFCPHCGNTISVESV